MFNKFNIICKLYRLRVFIRPKKKKEKRKESVSEICQELNPPKVSCLTFNALFWFTHGCKCKCKSKRKRLYVTYMETQTDGIACTHAQMAWSSAKKSRFTNLSLYGRPYVSIFAKLNSLSLNYIRCRKNSFAVAKTHSLLLNFIRIR